MQQHSLAIKIGESSSIWQHASYHKITKLVEGQGMIEAFENSSQPLHFTALVVLPSGRVMREVVVLRLQDHLACCCCMYACRIT
jgi:hypothetical protein